MTRIFPPLAASLVIGLFATGALTTTAGAEPVLRNNVVVTGPSIRLGDLFSDAGPRAAIEIAPAPALGGRTVLDAAWLAARAHEQKLDWQPKSRYEQATVERASQSVPAESIVAELKQELGNRLPGVQSELTLDNADLRLLVPAGPAPAILIDAMTFDARSGRLTAYVTASAGDVTTDRVRVTGRVRRMLEMPVLTRLVAPGETIAAQDIETITLPADRLNQSFVVGAADLVGKTPRRSIRPGEPIRPSDVQTPVVIRRGELVTVVFQSAALLLTAQAKALEDGTQGQAIRVSNTRSGKTLDATVNGPGTVFLATLSTTPAATAQKE
ncbi:MAG TPA: flagellar basal body P-ring formation chaperone FlgA [Stellaceae bacterium]|nr:flagellar basal body P-ring formation chaperone FlgA [Stellaceae bacterium]